MPCSANITKSHRSDEWRPRNTGDTAGHDRGGSDTLRSPKQRTTGTSTSVSGRLSGTPEKDGSQELSDLGIGFVQSIGDGLTGADMPNNGGATYDGNWVAAVGRQRMTDGDGDIVLVNGDAASLTCGLRD